jgi:hypothetical protein
MGFSPFQLLERRKNAKAGYVYHLYRRNHSRGLFGLYTGADVALKEECVSPG